MNKPVSFELAKLLKEKGFNEEVIHQWGIEYDWDKKKLVGKPHLNKKELDNYNSNRFIQNCSFSAPTIAEVVMWLHEKYGIWISVQPNEPFVDNDWCFTIFKNLKNNNSLEGYNSPIEAYEAAIEYTLNNLL